MPRDGAIIFRDIVGKLDVLNVECEKCGRRGRAKRPVIWEILEWISTTLGATLNPVSPTRSFPTSTAAQWF
jgi:hypothetical protein